VGHLPSFVKHRLIHSEQNVCEQDVIIGVSKKSLQTWQRRAASTAASCLIGVLSQSEGSLTSNEASMTNDDTATTEICKGFLEEDDLGRSAECVPSPETRSA